MNKLTFVSILLISLFSYGGGGGAGGWDPVGARTTPLRQCFSRSGENKIVIKRVVKNGFEYDRSFDIYYKGSVYSEAEFCDRDNNTIVAGDGNVFVFLECAFLSINNRRFGNLSKNNFKISVDIRENRGTVRIRTLDKNFFVGFAVDRCTY